LIGPNNYMQKLYKNFLLINQIRGIMIIVIKYKIF